MKYILKIALGLIVCMAALASCSDDDNGITGLKTDKEDITIGAEGGSDELEISSDSEWYANVSEPWVTISPANGLDGTTECTIVVDSTMSSQVRKAEIRISRKGRETRIVTVHQTGYGKMISIEKPVIEIESSDATAKRFFETSVTTNVPFNIELEYANNEKTGWITLPGNTTVELDRGYRPRTTKIRFTWSMNPDFDPRTVKIHFVPQKAEDILEVPAVLTVTQKASPRIEDNRAGDSLTLLIMKERLMSGDSWDPSENMRNWDNVVLWERNDKALPSQAAIGRLRSVRFLMMETQESIPQEVRYLTYAEKLYFYSNTNTMLKSIELGSDICGLKHLKDLTIGAYGLVSLPDDFVKLGATLERLDISSNNFTDVPSILTQENFPKLKTLSLVANRRWGTSDLRNSNKPMYPNGIGFHFNAQENPSLRRLFLWDTLESLSLSYNYMEGRVPDFTVDEVGNYSASDLTAFGDTLQWLYATPEGQKIPKVLPRIKHLAINLNFFTGSIPKWILYHPHLIEWAPEVLVFNQMENGIDSNGKVVNFDNVPKSFEYYYSVFPKYREKFEMKEEINDTKR